MAHSNCRPHRPVPRLSRGGNEPYRGDRDGRSILEGASFQTYAIEDFTPEQRDRFLDAWHDLVFRTDPRTGTERRGRMARAIEEAPSLQDLCKNPLLCAMLAFLQREHELPRRRHLLYQKVIERMAEHWEANKGLPPHPLTEQFELEDKLAFLRSLAWKMQCASPTSGNIIGRDELEDFTTAFCERRWGQSPDTARRRAEALIQHLHEREGVLAYLGADTYGFAHRAFLEHLAASDVVTRFHSRQCELSDVAPVFINHWHDPKWEETLLLLCGLLQEDGENGARRVVWLLQTIGGHRLDGIYREMGDYLALCVNALAELPQMSRDTPGDLAREINDIFVFLSASEGGLSGLHRDTFRALTSALRRCSGRWPGVDALVRVSIQLSARWGFAPGGWKPCVAAAGKVNRIDIIRQSLQHGVFSLSAVSEAARQGPWTPSEVSRLSEAAAQMDPRQRFSFVRAVVGSRGNQWQKKDFLISILRSHIASRDDSIDRLECARILEDVGIHDPKARQMVEQEAESDNPNTAERAIMLLMRWGSRDKWLDRLGELAKTSAHAFACLRDVSTTDPAARALLRNAIVAIRQIPEPTTFLELACAAMRARLATFSLAEIAGAFDKLPDNQTRWMCLVDFSRTPELVKLRLDVAHHLLQNNAIDKATAWAASRVVDPRIGGAALISLWDKLLCETSNDLALAVAHRVLECSPAGEIEVRASLVRDRALSNSGSDQTRLKAATLFERTSPHARQVLENLANNAEDNVVRLEAARLTGNLAAL
ncbi:MAG: hypothetical protein R3B70_46290, partial [Polyangiaceae bacterium]